LLILVIEIYLRVCLLYCVDLISFFCSSAFSYSCLLCVVTWQWNQVYHCVERANERTSERSLC